MSVVAALVDDKGQIIMGGDSRSTTEGDERFYTNMSSKITVYSDCIIGVVGGSRFCNLVQQVFLPPPIPTGSTEEYLVRAFVPALIKLCKQHDLNFETDGGEILFGYDCELWFIQEDMAVDTWCEPWGAIGSGALPAWGSLYSTQGWKDGKRRVLTACRAAGNCVPSVGGPYYTEVLKHEVE